VLDDFFNVRIKNVQIVILLHSEISNLNVLANTETRMFKSLLGAPHGTAINGDEQLARFCRFDHPADMAPDACQTEIPANTLLSQPDGSLIGNLTHIGTASTRENQNFIRFTKASLFHFFRPRFPSSYAGREENLIESSP
jgi:hypothetical protein